MALNVFLRFHDETIDGCWIDGTMDRWNNVTMECKSSFIILQLKVKVKQSTKKSKSRLLNKKNQTMIRYLMDFLKSRAGTTNTTVTNDRNEDEDQPMFPGLADLSGITDDTGDGNDTTGDGDGDGGDVMVTM
jgi:hypothetical protein